MKIVQVVITKMRNGHYRVVLMGETGVLDEEEFSALSGVFAYIMTHSPEAL